MNKTPRVPVGILLAAVVMGCAQSPENIVPIYVADDSYQSWTCDQLSAEQARLRAALATSSEVQTTGYRNDIAGVILLGLPVGSMAGQDLAPQIARTKGEQEAVHRAMTKKPCSEQQN